MCVEHNGENATPARGILDKNIPKGLPNSKPTHGILTVLFFKRPFWKTVRGVMIPAQDLTPESDLWIFWNSDSNSRSRLLMIRIHLESVSTSGSESVSWSTTRVRLSTKSISNYLWFQAKWAKIGFFLHFELDPDPEMDSDLGVDLEPPWIRIQVTSIPALLDAIQPPAPDPQKVELLGCYFTK